MATTATRLRDRRRLDDCGWADTDQHDRELGEEVHLVHGSPQQGPGQGVRHGFRRRLPEYPVSATAEALSLPPESDAAAAASSCSAARLVSGRFRSHGRLVEQPITHRDSRPARGSAAA
jgi:hypothetical protein